MRSRFLFVILAASLVGCSLHLAAVSTPTDKSVMPKIIQTGSSAGWVTFSISPAGQPYQVAADNTNGMIWWSTFNTNQVGRMDMFGKVTTFTVHGICSRGIAISSNGDAYVGEQVSGGYAIDQLTPQGVSKDIPLPHGVVPVGLLFGSDGNLWIVSGSSPVGFGRLTSNGVYSDFTHGLTRIDQVVIGPDNNFWLEPGNSPTDIEVARIQVSDGSMTTFPMPNQYIENIASGADGGLWIYDAGPDPPTMIRMDPVTGNTVSYPGKANVGFMLSGPNRLLYLWDERRIFEYSVDRKKIVRRIGVPSGCSDFAAIGPDTQVWLGGGSAGFCVYLLHPIVPIPSSITVGVHQSTGLSVSESRSLQKNFTVVSRNPNVAKVSGSGQSFTVSGVFAGLTTVSISDEVGNRLDVAVTVN